MTSRTESDHFVRVDALSISRDEDIDSDDVQPEAIIENPLTLCTLSALLKPAKVPIWAWVLLAFSVFGVSCAGSIFQQLGEIPPLMRASWRLQATSAILLPLTVWQWQRTPENIRKQCFERKTLVVLGVSSIAVAAHFGCWVAALDLTTLTHALLFVCCHPIIIAMGMFVLSRLPQPLLKGLQACGLQNAIRNPNKIEYTGVVIGFIGACLALLDVGNEQGKYTVTFLGDFIAFLGALSFIAYQICGRILRVWMPIFIYALPVTLLGGLILIPVSLLVEEHAPAFGVFGWASVAYIWWFVALALIAGLLGHTGLNTCLLYMSPLLVCTATTLEPAVGSVVGWAVFKTGLPGAWSCIGGFILMCSVLLVTYGSHIANLDTKPAEHRQRVELPAQHGEVGNADAAPETRHRDHIYRTILPTTSATEAQV